MGKSSLRMDTKATNSITLDDAFKNMLILHLIGIVTSTFGFLWEILQVKKHNANRDHRNQWV